MVIELSSPVQSCPDGVTGLAIFGGVVLFSLLYFLVFLLVKEILLAIKGKNYDELSSSEKSNLMAYAGFWFITIPVTILVGIAYVPIRWIILAFTAVEKRDLEEVEKRLNQKIILNGVKVPVVNKKRFQVGDLITGIKGNPDNYKHLNEGCLCRVVSIDEKEIMKLVLINHKDFKEHTEKIGEVFTAPARNFVVYKETKTKKR